MSKLKFRRVPWVNKEEWLEVYHEVNDKRDVSAYSAAIDHMETWIKSGACPPAVEYTCRFLQCVVRDKHYFEIDSPECDTNLQTQYSTSLLRFINIFGEIESVKSLSLNARAQKLGLPEWVVNTRHQISHGCDLPSLDVLRVSVEALLNWLKLNYWEVEKVAMNDVVIANKHSLLEENMFVLFNIYSYLNDVKTEFHSIRDLDDASMKMKIRNIENLMFHSFKTNTSPWSAQTLPGHNLVMEPKKIMKLSVYKAIILVIRIIRVYLEHQRDEALPIFVKILLSQTKTSGFHPELWEPFMVWLHSKGAYPQLLLQLLDELTRDESDFYDQAKEWIVLLLQSLIKRRRVEEKIKKLNTEAVSEPVSKKMKLSLTDRQLQFLIKERVKHQLRNEVDESKKDIVANVFNIIERQFPPLKNIYRLKTGDFPNENDYLLMMTKVFLSPRNAPPEIGRLVTELSKTINKTTLSYVRQLAFVKKDRALDNISEVARVYDWKMLDSYIRRDFSSKAVE